MSCLIEQLGREYVNVTITTDSKCNNNLRNPDWAVKLTLGGFMAGKSVSAQGYGDTYITAYNDAAKRLYVQLKNAQRTPETFR